MVYYRRYALLIAIAATLWLGMTSRSEAGFCQPNQLFGQEFVFTGSMQQCTIQTSGTYIVTAWGAAGGDQRIDNLNPSVFGGQGTAMAANFALLAGDILQFLVGGKGGTAAGELFSGEIYAGGGGGGTFVALSRYNGNFEALIVGGGGGGAGTASAGQAGRGLDGGKNVPNGNGQYSNGGAGGLYGTGGGGANTATGGAGGGGFYESGGNSGSATGGASFNNGGWGGGPISAFCFGAAGGFGGGGGAAWSDCTQSGGPGGGGGGGYSGGGGGGWDFWGNDGGAGGGGSSYVNSAYFVGGLNVQVGYNLGDGLAAIAVPPSRVDVVEPGSLALLASGVAMFGLRRRRG